MIKNFFSMIVGTTLGSEAMKSAGNIGGSIGKATQSAIGIGTLGFVAGKSMSMFKWKK